MTHPSLTLIRGLPGSGKSTLAQMLVSAIPNSVYYEADMYFIVNGVYTFDHSKLSDAHSWCQQSTIKALEQGKSVIVSNTFTTKKEVQPYQEIARRFSVVPNIILCQGSFQSIHGVPDSVIDRMKGRFEYDIS